MHPVQQKARERLDRPRSLFETLDCECAAQDPLGQTIVCACEGVTAAEIHAALQSPLPARSIGGIARRTPQAVGIRQRRVDGRHRADRLTLLAEVASVGGAYGWLYEATLGVGRSRNA